MVMEEKKYSKKWSGKGKATVNREFRTVNRGRLAPLMSEEAKATASIHELSYDFGCRITRLFLKMLSIRNTFNRSRYTEVERPLGQM